MQKLKRTNTAQRRLDRLPTKPSKLPNRVKGSSLPAAVGRIFVRRCEYVNCRGGVNGCNGIYCDKARWERMTPDEYREHYRKEPPNAVSNPPAAGE